MKAELRLFAGNGLDGFAGFLVTLAASLCQHALPRRGSAGNPASASVQGIASCSIGIVTLRDGLWLCGPRAWANSGSGFFRTILMYASLVRPMRTARSGRYRMHARCRCYSWRGCSGWSNNSSRAGIWSKISARTCTVPGSPWPLA